MSDGGENRAAAPSLRRIRALIRKEALQVLRDPSSLVVAFVLPALLLFLFGFGISFDATRLKIGLVVEQPTPDTASFAASLVISRSGWRGVIRPASR